MNATDQRKLTDQGFMIIRERDFNPVSRSKEGLKLEIWAKRKEQPEWHQYVKNFKSKAARRRSMKILLGADNVIED